MEKICLTILSNALFLLILSLPQFTKIIEKLPQYNNYRKTASGK